MMSPRGFFILAVLFVINAEAQLVNKNSDPLTPEQRQIIKNYEAIAKLNLGDTCNAELEAKGNTFREYFKPASKKVFISAFHQRLDGKTAEEVELSQSTEDAREELLAGIQEFTAKIEKSNFDGICNDRKTLYCDEEVGECRCGKAKKVKGFSLVAEDRVCKFDLGSGCLETEFVEMTDGVTCKKGSRCVTAIENAPCTLPNMMEAVQNPSRFDKIVTTYGITCFCDK